MFQISSIKHYSQIYLWEEKLTVKVQMEEKMAHKLIYKGSFSKEIRNRKRVLGARRFKLQVESMV